MIEQLFSLDGKIVVLTGASSGIGQHYAKTLDACGATVVAAARRADRLSELADSGERIEAATCDVSLGEQREDLIAGVLDRHGRIDVLVNNAGIAFPQPAETEPMDDWRMVLDVNLDAVFHLSQLAGRSMIERRSGSIINVASVLGSVASAPIKQASYCASKGGVVNLTRELGCQWARKGVRVNAIAPGWFRSEMTQDMWDDDSSLGFINTHCPMGREGELGELDGALVYLASDASSYVTGQVLTVDGGWTAR